MYAIIGFKKNEEVAAILSVTMTKEEAETYTGIESMQMENDGVEMRIVEFDELDMLADIRQAKAAKAALNDFTAPY